MTIKEHQMNYSTIDIAALKKLKTVELHTKWETQKTSGNACYLDAPGFPTYFTKHIYTERGDSPLTGPTMVIEVDGVNHIVGYADESFETIRSKLAKLWLRDAVSAERFSAWERTTFTHFAHCYVDDDRNLDTSSIFIFPVPNFKLKHFFDDVRFSDEYRSQAKAEVEQYNADLIAKSAALAEIGRAHV